jgi:hypothetical protein
MPLFHKIRAYLYSNVFTENPNDYIARVHSAKFLNVRDVCRTATGRGKANISAETMEYAVNLWFREMAYHLCNGCSVNTGWFIVSAVIRGVFGRSNEKFNSAKHSVAFDFKQGTLLRKELENVEVSIVGVAGSPLFVIQVMDTNTGSINNLLTPKRVVRINGAKLKIAGDNPANGVYFVNREKKERIQADIIIANKPSELLALIPEMPAGTYSLEITTQYSGSTTLKTPRTTVFHKPLTVKEGEYA